MRRVVLQRWLHATRAVLLLVTLAAGVTAYAWIWQPAAVQDLGAALRQRALRPYQEQLQEGVRLLSLDRARGVTLLAELVGELQAAKNGDRLGEIKRQALEALVAVHAEAGEASAALESSEQLVAFDARDLPVRLRHGELLCARPERAYEGLAALRELHALLPADVRVAVALAQAELDHGQPDTAVATLLRRQGAVQSNLWELRWGPPGLRDALTTGFLTPVRSGDALELEFELEAGVSECRLHLPPYAALSLRAPELTVRAGDQEQRLLLRELEPQLSGMVWEGENLVSRGGLLPFFGLRLPGGPAPLVLTCVLRAQVAERLPAEVFAMLAAGPLRDALAESVATGDRDAAALSAALRAQAIRGGRVELFWRRQGEAFAGERRAVATLTGPMAAEGLAFALEFEVAAEVTHLRLDLPEGVGVEYCLASLEVITAVGSLTLDPAALVVETPHGLEREAATFRVTGSDPYFSVALPEESAVRRVRVEGTAR